MIDEPVLRDYSVRGIRIISGETANCRRYILEKLRHYFGVAGFQEIVLPTIELSEVYIDKAGPEILSQMYTFQDKKDNPRSLCLRPEGTATCQLLASGPFKQKRDLHLWYEARCFRYERPQSGRYREFTQFGVEILNPTEDYTDKLIDLAETCLRDFAITYEVKRGAKRGLAYYDQGQGFEIVVPSLGAQQQVLGGGSYPEGIGFAFGVDRLMLALPYFRGQRF